MAVFRKTLYANNFIESDGKFVGTILATTHGLGTVIHVDKMQRHIGSTVYENVLESHCILANGDVEIYVDEADTYRITLSD